MQRAIVYRRPQRRKDLVWDLFSKSVTLEPPRTNWNIEEVRMDKNLKCEQGGAGGSGLSQIEELAYTLWGERGCPVGSPEVDWFEAERRLSLHPRSPHRVYASSSI